MSLVILSSTGGGWFGALFGFAVIFIAFVMLMTDNGRDR